MVVILRDRDLVMSIILHTARYTGIPLEILKRAVPERFEVTTLGELNYDCLVREAVNADYLLVSGRFPVDEGVLSTAKYLKMIQRTGVGTEMLEVRSIVNHIFTSNTYLLYDECYSYFWTIDIGDFD